MMYEKLTLDTPEEQPEEGKPYEAYVSESEDECSKRGASCGTSCGTYGTSNRPDWMSRMGPRFLTSKLGEVIWPGTHDSGAYCQEFDYRKVVHHDTLRWVGTHFFNCLGPSVNKVASKWSQTQTMNVKEQLEHGVRYLDLRVSRCVQDGCYYIVHSFCGPSLEDVLEQIAGFMSRHKEECLLLEVDPVSEVDHVELHNIFDRRLGGLLLKRERDSHSFSPMSLTLSQLIAKGRVVVLYRIPALYGFKNSIPCFWESKFLYAPFVMSLDPSVKEGHQLEQFLHFSSRYHGDASKKHQNLFHFMYALTPTLSDILKGAVKPMLQSASESPGNLQECAQRINPRMARFLDRIKQHIRSERCCDMGMIFSVDHVGDSDLMDHIISLNELRFRDNNN